MSTDTRAARLLAVREACVALADPESTAGQKLRAALRETSLLSPAGIEYALGECLEHRAGRAQVSQLARRAPAAPNVHVLLAGNVFTAAYRAVLLALAQSERVFVRPSRRGPEFVRALAEASGGAFQIVDALAPAPGDHYWAYGTDETLSEVKKSLPGGVHFHAHGSGLGAAVLQLAPQEKDSELEKFADALARDVIAFDQRGCLSPRVALVQAEERERRSFAGHLARALDAWEARIPRGALTPEELAEERRYALTMTYVGGVLPAGRGFLHLDPEPERLFVPPIGRHLQIVSTADPAAALARLGSRVTTVGYAGPDPLPGRLQAVVGAARVVPLGQMQTPPLDGPVDLRHGWNSETS